MSPAWLNVLILTFLAGVLLNFPWLIYFSVAIGLVLALAHQWRRRALNRLAYSRRFRYTRGFPGEQTEVRITIENNKLLPVSWLRASDEWPEAVGPADTSILAPSHNPLHGFLVNLYSLRWHERIQRGYTLLFRKRGIYELGPLTFEAGDLFGLFEKREERPLPQYLTVFPELLPIERFHLRTEDPFGDRRSPRPLFEDPSQAIGIRPYHPEDSFRRIHWPATARTGELQVKVYQPVAARVLVICMNVSTEVHFWLGYNQDLLEYLVKVCTTLAYQANEDGYAVGLFANGCLSHSDQPFRIRPGRAQGQLTLLLQALAGVTPYVIAPFESFLVRSMSEIPFGATILVVTALLPETLQDTLMRLRRYRSHITLVSLDPTPPPDLPGIHILHLPFDREMPPL